MMWIVLYVVVGVVVARQTKIHLGRKARAHRQWVYDRCSLCTPARIGRGEYRCPRHGEKGVELAADVFPVLGLFWPLTLLWYTAKWFGIGIALTATGIGWAFREGFKILWDTPPLKMLSRANRWFWQDPHDRKKDRHELAA